MCKSLVFGMPYVSRMTVQTGFWIVTTFLFGISIGSFLNVVIWRLPRGGSLTKPQWSYCPNCEHQLSALDLIPLFSFLLLGQKCRYCKKPISWRYFGVELLTGLLFVSLYLRYPQDAPNAVFMLLFAALLVPMYFIDLDFFIIPEALNLLAFVVAVGRDVYGIVTHEAGHELLWGWLPRSILGAVVGVLIFGAVRVLGWIWKRQEAMGLGDVLLARAMGAMLISVVPVGANPLRLFPIWVFLSCISGLVLGGGKLLLARSKQSLAVEGASQLQEDEPPAEDNSSIGKELYEIGLCLWLGDAIEYIQECMPAARKSKQKEAEAAQTDDWKPAPSAIPFGPGLIVGFLATVFCGEIFTAWYLAYAFPKKESGTGP